jgi:hypothetical protein
LFKKILFFFSKTYALKDLGEQEHDALVKDLYVVSGSAEILHYRVHEVEAEELAFRLDLDFSVIIE